ncbi:Hypothetical predicted protein [Lecanosticta acicola]|uniref:Deacetylase complex subunit n=1 Tax=Lecanosticta acicola TaxID=111012 RepID=A0AAI8W1F3_9PEZI|nr:Hypothetical predicted protein [Lecanosticta acicola]
MAIARQTSPFDHSPSPQPQPLTKRDVRRNRIMEKLQGMVNSFSANQHNHYRAQLQGVQVDMTLVLRADPYRDGPLDDGHDEIQALAEDVMAGDANGNGGVSLPNDEAARQDYWSIAGKRYSEFVRNINDAIEERDADLAQLNHNYKSSMKELDDLYQQRLHQAEEEHKALTNTIRSRLISNLNKKKTQLLRDKEQLDISDSNAMLLHPNHFSIRNNPGSPSQNGAGISKRTRHLRHNRGASPAPAGAEAGEGGKRKRKLAQMEDDQGNESPLPHLAGGRSPFKDARGQREYAQFEAPAYSIERLFTEKELAMATDTARVATWKYFHQPKEQQEQSSNGNGTAVPSLDGEVVESAEVVPADEQMTDATAPVNGADTPPPSEPSAAAPGMERSASHQVLTRGGARNNPLAALDQLAAAAASSTSPVVKRHPFVPVAPGHPHIHATMRSEKMGAPAPPPVGNLDIESDFNMIRDAGADADEHASIDPEGAQKARDLRRDLYHQALDSGSGVQAPYRLPQLETGPGALLGRGVDREPRTGFAPVLPVVAHIQSRSHVTGTVPAGISMAAALSGRLGGEPMSRTTSAGGASETGEGRRGRGRGQ